MNRSDTRKRTVSDALMVKLQAAIADAQAVSIILLKGMKGDDLGNIGMVKKVEDLQKSVEALQAKNIKIGGVFLAINTIIALINVWAVFKK